MRRLPLGVLLACLMVALMGLAGLDGPGAKEKKKAARLPVRVAVLPFALEVKPPADLLQRRVAEILREQFFNRFASLRYLDIDLAEVDRRLQGADISAEQAASPSDSQRLATILGVDGLVVGQVKEVSTFKGGIITEARLGGTIKLISSDGSVVWEKEHSESKHGGLLLRGGELLRALEDIQGQFKDERLLTYLKLAEEFSRKVVADMPQPTREGEGRVAAPRIHRVTVESETTRVLRPGDQIRVTVEGDPGMIGALDLGRWRGGLPMVEVSPGKYVGTYNVQAGDAARGVPARVRLANAFGLSATAQAPGAALTIDGEPPPSPKEVVADVLAGQGVVVRWRAVGDTAGVAIYRSCPPGGKLTLLAKVTDGASYTDRSGPASAGSCNYQVVAYDARRNLSYPAVATWKSRLP